MTENLIEEGYRTLREEVIKKQWPEASAHFQLLLEVTFYAGATWIMKIIEDEGSDADLLDRLNAELDAHRDKAAAMREALDEETP